MAHFPHIGSNHRVIQTDRTFCALLPQYNYTDQSNTVNLEPKLQILRQDFTTNILNNVYIGLEFQF
ncbi:hypothetical protein OUZ56_016464 [Daphnia magna]|uniref:Uncharacterized protein n=1 Tax=Daphnia magna TaxID=35525 RepID=A0ABR0AR04_9CRUS|nr:hypothetical protein OUZ56_016464 [Daphnia magna]